MNELLKTQAEYVRLYADDVIAHPTHFKARIVANPIAEAYRLIDGLSLAEVKQLIRDHRDEQRALGRASKAA